MRAYLVHFAPRLGWAVVDIVVYNLLDQILRKEFSVKMAN